ncbi:hypothetical protein RND71_019363 [Anisodus tanguticus]|uniref:DUF4218 domain-containing protein n=1 Tax=Anisodus tanguticus TaxID=243964 RepID=A0AAE1S0R3_9SOLA|nr:hypothetical protein RND71_019363 [Anisodus tanguticus]
MCTMETIFLPSFFTIMVHLVIHLAMEAKITGPVQHRWMYPIERFLRTLKYYVRNLSCPEGSIAEVHIVNKGFQFCSRYMEGGDLTSYWSRKSKDDIEHEVDKERCLFPTVGKSDGLVQVFKLDHKTWVQAHRYVLFNCESDVVNNSVYDPCLYLCLLTLYYSI